MSTNVAIFCQSDIPLPRHGRKCFFAGLKPVSRYSPHFFDHFGGYIASIGSTFAKTWAETFFNGLWKTGFTSFSTLFRALWCLFYVNRMYHCQDTGENVSSRVFNPVLGHSPFFFEPFGGYFALIGRTIAKILAKKFLRGHWNWFYGICRTFLSTLVDIFFWSGVPLQKYGETFLCWLWNRFYGILHTFFSTLVSLLRWSYVPLPKYRQKRFFAGIEIGFTAITVIFFEHFCGNFA